MIDVYSVYNDALTTTTEQIVEFYHEFLASEGRENTPCDRLDFWDEQYSRIVDIIAANTRSDSVRRAIIATLLSNVEDVFEDGSLPVFDVGMYAYDGSSAFDSFKIMCSLKFSEMAGR